MIPTLLELENFLSYREKVCLDLDGIHLACIAGANGAGKSSLLDAMTWALFGQSRSKSDDDVVNRRAALQQKAAEVRFTFHLDGVTYRVIRRKKIGRSVVLEFQIQRAEDSWNSLSEGGVRETQNAINSLLRMNFDNFINASFFLQGQADAFTTKTPNKRKEILADLLGVSDWEEHKEKVAVHRREAKDQLLLIESKLHEVDQELAERPEREATLLKAEEEVKTIGHSLELHEKLLGQGRQTETYLEQEKQSVRNIDENLKRAELNLRQSNETRERREQEREQHQGLIDRAESIAADYESWQELDRIVQAWQEKAERHHAIQLEKKPHELVYERERSRLEQRRDELEAQEKRIEVLGVEREELTAILAEEKQQLQEISKKLQMVSEIEKRYQSAHSDLQRLESERALIKQELDQLRDRERRVSEHSKLREQLGENLKEAQEAILSLSDQLETLNRLRDELMTAMGERDLLKGEQITLRQEMDKIKERLVRLQEEFGPECPLCGQPLSDTHRQVVLSQLEEEGNEKGYRFRSNKGRIEELAADIASINEQIMQGPSLERSLLAQKSRLEKATARLEESTRVIDEWESTGAERLLDLTAHFSDESGLNDKKAEVQELEQAVQAKEKLEGKKEMLQENTSQTKARLGEIERRIGEWFGDGEDGQSNLLAEFANIKKRLHNEKIALTAQEALAEIKAREIALAYDKETHMRAVETRDLLGDARERYHNLQTAQATVSALDQSLADLAKQIAEQQQAIGEFRRQLTAAEQKIQILQEDSIDIKALETEVNNLREQQIKAHQMLATAKQSLNVLETLSKQSRQFKEEQVLTRKRIQRLKVIEKACGREGVQALLIERALPEIEDDANELLNRLSDGQMSIAFETQRQLKTRDRLAETLDIRIVDNFGERPYENYSGGEQFRVNFAIRLALSKILTRRAGARLQTLVIDEGFGSQDPQGRQRLIESINAIQDEFEKILVITHVDELRDAFPSRIEVTKEPAGSTITIA